MATTQAMPAADAPALGVKITCPFMPYGPAVNQIVHLSNPSTNTANVVVTAFDDQGVTYDLGVVAVAGTNRVTKMHAVLASRLTAEGFAGGTIAYEFTVTNSAVNAHFSYNSGGSGIGFVAHQRELFPLAGPTGTPAASPALGIKITCPYMPYSATASQIIHLANTSTNAAAISVRAFTDAGDVFDLGQLTTATGRKVTKMNTIVKNALAAAGFTDGAVAFEFICNNPAVIGHFSYNVGGTDLAHIAPQREFYALPPANP